MKISLSWVFDHIDAPWQTVDVHHLVAEFNKKTAEIDSYYPVSLDLNTFTLVSIQEINADSLVAFSEELDASFVLNKRADAHVGMLFLLKNKESAWQWADTADLHGEKEGFVPALSCAEPLQAGGWKQTFQAEDWIIDVDNKSINHRPDLWGHRGIARECAILLDLPLKPLDEFCTVVPVQEYEKKALPLADQPFTISIENQQLCKRFGALYFPKISNRASDLNIAHRLIKVASKPITLLVDLTNYVMFDVGQPMHAFDAAKIADKTVVVRLAKHNEKMMLLDGDDVTLSGHNLIISDAKKPLALAGIMGGRSSAVELTTDTILLEAACFDAANIRKTSLEVKKRTEASARFEKSLDPNQNIYAIERFVQLALEHHLLLKDDLSYLVSIGAASKESFIKLHHGYIENRLGAALEPSFVVGTLKKLGFSVQEQEGHYTIGVPTYRSTKDSIIKEDIVEEVGRIYGYDRIEPRFPKRIMKPFDTFVQEQLRLIKQTMAYALGLKEVYHYGFFDESFLAEIKWKPRHTLEVKSPVSENWKQLVTTLVPGLLKVVAENAPEHEQLGFFECARVWRTDNKAVQEKQMLTAVMFNKKEPVDFYEAKAELSLLFHVLGLSVEWERIDEPECPWFAPHKTARIVHNGVSVGVAGNVHKQFLSTVSPGDAFICELDADFLLSYKRPHTLFSQSSKYPAVERDISMLVPVDCTVDSLIKRIKKADKRIVSVSLVDFFEKSEWHNQKSVTLRFVMSDLHKTLTKQEVDLVWDAIAADMKNLGAIIR